MQLIEVAYILYICGVPLGRSSQMSECHGTAQYTMLLPFGRDTVETMLLPFGRDTVENDVAPIRSRHRGKRCCSLSVATPYIACTVL